MAEHGNPTSQERDPERFRHLPEPVDPRDMVTTQETDPPPDPRGGRDTETDFMLRYGAGG